MSKIFSKISLGLLVAGAMAWSASAAAPLMKTLSGHVPQVVSQLASTGRLAGTNHLHMAIGLALRNQDGLQALLDQINDPASSNYHHYLTPDQFTAQFGPTEKDYQAVIDYATANGFTVLARHDNRTLLEVDAISTNVERAFNVHLRTYHLSAENRDFYAPDTEPSVPSALPVLDIQGLNNYVHPRPRVHVKQPVTKATKAGSGPFGSFLGNDFRAAYVPGTPLTGAGQKVALFEYDGYLASDIAQYEQRAGYATVALTNVLLQGFSGNPFDPAAQTEVTLDIDMVIAMAPGISQVQVYEGNIQVAYLPNLVLNKIAIDNSARQISCSWGWSGGPSGTTDQIFKQMILQGQTFFDASGDVCAFLPPGPSGNAPGSVDDPNVPNAPSDDPYITQVGATTLQTTGPGGSYVSESVWNWGTEFPGQGYDGVGSSGGISGYYALPTWQQGVNMTTNQGSTSKRNLPDVAMPGDNIFIIQNGVDEPGVGGTSCAAPLWAGFIALVNQQAVSNSLPAVGFINPALYALAHTANYATLFRDVVIGNNTWSQSPTNFNAVPGYDLCTGLGSPTTSLISALAGAATNTALGGGVTTPTLISAPQISPNWVTNLSVMNGSNPNGDWFLFIQDDTMIDAGMINNGWYVTLTTANPVGYPADNAVYTSVTNVVVPPGTNFSITLSVTNYGPAASTNVLVTDTLPTTGVTLLSSNATLGTIDRVGGTLVWNVSNLVVNTGGSLTLNFKANTVGSYVNTPTVSAGINSPDPNPDDDTAPTAITVALPTPPVLSGSAEVEPGNHFQFNVAGGYDIYGVGTSVIVQASTNLVKWVPIYTNVTPFTYTNLNGTNIPYQFFRVITGP